MKKHDFLVIGAGIFGIAAAIELRQRKYSVGVLNPSGIPHPLAASTDISKVVRMEYGSDILYMEMAEASIEGWLAWNDLFNETLYHETGFLLVCRESMDEPRQYYEKASFDNLLKKGYQPQRLDAESIESRFPGIARGRYTDGFFNPKAGYVEAARVIEVLTKYAQQIGVIVYEGQTVDRLIESGGQISQLTTKEGENFEAGHYVVCAGAFSPYLVPDLQPFMRITGHPVFHVKPGNPEIFSAPKLPVFAADISNSGWYGFPFHPKEKVVKVGNHGTGLELHPELDERIVYEEDIQRFKQFLKETFPAMAYDPIVFTRRCLYTDTLDGHYWIDCHPSISNLTIGTGGSGHGLKMGPVLGPLIATAAEGGSQRWSERFRWRKLSSETKGEEQARFQER